MPSYAAPLTDDSILARVLYRDGMMLIVDKPAGLPVHAGPGGGPNLEMSFDALRFGLPRPPALANRLDRDTSGCLVLGRHRKALRRLGILFQNGRVEKTYWAIVEGDPEQGEGRIEKALAKVTNKGGWKMMADPFGQPAVTDYKVMGRADGLTWLALYPRTGRTHQIRVHCAAMGWPLLGDPVYGVTPHPKQPLHLHARAVSVPLYPTKLPIAVTAEPPPHMAAALRRCGSILD